MWEATCCTYRLHLPGGQPASPVSCPWLRGPRSAHNFCVLDWTHFPNRRDRLDTGPRKRSRRDSACVGSFRNHGKSLPPPSGGCVIMEPQAERGVWRQKTQLSAALGLNVSAASCMLSTSLSPGSPLRKTGGAALPSLLTRCWRDPMRCTGKLCKR